MEKLKIFQCPDEKTTQDEAGKALSRMKVDNAEITAECVNKKCNARIVGSRDIDDGGNARVMVFERARGCHREETASEN